MNREKEERAFSPQAISRLAYGLVLAGSVGLLFLNVAAPVFAALGEPELSQAFYLSLSKACHQNASRSFTLFGWPMGVCSRCTGLYIGALVGTLLVPLVRGVRAELPRRIWLALAALPCALDVALDWVGIMENTLMSRAATGLLLGGVAAFYVVPAIVEAGFILAADRRRRMEASVNG